MPKPLVLSFLPQEKPHEILVQASAGRRELFLTRFTCRSGHRLRPSGDALVCLGLYPAAEIGADLHVKGAVSPCLRSNARAINRLYRRWWPSCRNVAVVAPEGVSMPAQVARGTGLFFSGGADSAFSLADAAARVSSLITLIGVDMPLSDSAETARLEALAKEVAQAKGLDSIVIETDVSSTFHAFASWIEHHGAVLAAIGHMLSDHLERVLIASSGNETAWDVPWGSHPGLDPLFGSQALAVEHHGLVSRFDKIARVAGDDVLLSRLRVCNKARRNCGMCSKCTFAMRSLDILGAKARASSFPPFEPRRGAFGISDDASLDEHERLRDAAMAAGRADLLPEIEEAIGAYRHRTRRQRFGGEGLRIRARVMRHRLRWWRASL